MGRDEASKNLTPIEEYPIISNMLKEGETFVPTVLFHGTAEYNISTLAAHGLVSSRDTLTPSPIIAMYGAWQHYRGSNQVLTVWYPQLGDVKTHSSDGISYHIEHLITEPEKVLLRRDLEAVLEGRSEMERKYRLLYFQELDRLLPASRLGAYLLLNGTIGKFLHELEMGKNDIFDQELKTELMTLLQRASISCFNGKNTSQIASDIISTVVQFRQISLGASN